MRTPKQFTLKEVPDMVYFIEAGEENTDVMFKLKEYIYAIGWHSDEDKVLKYFQKPSTRNLSNPFTKYNAVQIGHNGVIEVKYFVPTVPLHSIDVGTKFNLAGTLGEFRKLDAHTAVEVTTWYIKQLTPTTQVEVIH